MKEIDINIEGYNVNGICVGCLNYKRKMFYVDAVKECFKILAEIDVPDGLSIQVCWECLAAARKVMRFKEQILNAYDILIDYSAKNPFLSSPSDFTTHSTTRLSTSVVTKLVLNADPIAEVKIEPGEGGKGEEEYEVEVKDEDLKFEDESLELDVQLDGVAQEQSVSSDEDVQLSTLRDKKEKKDKKVKKTRKKRKKDTDKEPEPKKYKSLPPDVEMYTMTEEEMWAMRDADRASEQFRGQRSRCEDCLLTFHSEQLMRAHTLARHQEPGGKNEPTSSKSSPGSNPSSVVEPSEQSIIINGDSVQQTRTFSPTGTTSALSPIADSQHRESFAITPDTNNIARESSCSVTNITPAASKPQVSNTNEPIVKTVPARPSVSAGTAASSYSINEQNNVISSNMLLKIFEGQEEIKLKLAELQAKVDTILVHLVDLSKTALSKSDDTVSNKSAVIKPVNSRRELEELEECLKKENKFSEIVSAMTFICGTTGKSKGSVSCYKLIDYFFTRDLLLSCSWTGCSRQNDVEGKIPLKYFYHTRKCFLSIVRKADRDFSEQDCDKFFKTIIKNAKQRINPKIKSAAKCRRKKSTSGSTVQIATGTSQENNYEEREQKSNEEENENGDGKEQASEESAGEENADALI